MKRAGLVVFLYAFMHSFFGVGAFRNAFGSAPLAGAGRLLASLYAICWAAFFVAAALLFLRRNAGIAVARAAAAGAIVIHLTGLVLMGGPKGPDAHIALFAWSQSFSPLFLFLLLPALGHGDGAPPRDGRRRSALVIAAGALLPWLAALAALPFADGPLLSQEMKPLLGLFMSLWCALPFAAIAAAVPGLPPSRREPVLLGGLAGIVVASVYAYSLVWMQGFNAFLMALLPPVVFTGAVLGILAGPAAIGALHKRRGGDGR